MKENGGIERGMSMPRLTEKKDGNMIQEKTPKTVKKYKESSEHFMRKRRQSKASPGRCIKRATSRNQKNKE